MDREVARPVWKSRPGEDFIRDVRIGLRGLWRQKLFAASAIGTLALGIGANAAIFSIVDGVLFKPLPFAEPSRLVQMYGTPATRGQAVERLSELREQSSSFDYLAGYAVGARYIRSSDGLERVKVVTADRELFALLGVASMAGRTFNSGDSSTVAVVSERFWREQLEASPAAIGSSLVLDNVPVTVIGVMPETFQFPFAAASVLPGVAAQGRTDMWVPLDQPADPMLRKRSRSNNVVGRLKRGVALAQAESELAVITARFAIERPDPYGARGVRLQALADVVVAPPIRRALFVLFGSVLIVLGLACANVANLSLVRVALRSREVAAMVALGASRGRVVRRFVTEHLVLAFLGGAAGLFIAWWSLDSFALIAGPYLPRTADVGLDWRVFAFLSAACLGVGVLSGVTPALFAAGTHPHALLEDGGGRSTLGGGLRRLRDLLVVVEVALALALAVGATLLVRELYRLRRTDAGMVSTNVVTLHLGQQPALAGINRRGAPPDVETRPYYDIAEQVSEINGVRAAGFTQVLPLQNWGWSANAADLRVAGRTEPPPPPFTFELRYVTPGYFEALSMVVRRGRGFAESDTRETPPVIVVNETMARRLIGPGDAIGAVTSRGEIVGVIGDVRNVNLDQPALPELYYPLAQNYSQLSELGMTLVVKADGPVEPIIGAIRSAVRERGPELAIFDVKTMDRVVAESMSAFSMFLWLMLLFAAIAVTLALTGTYGVISHAAASRTREFAVRVALGASPGDVVRLVLRQSAGLTVLGLAAGAVISFAAAPLLSGLPVAVRPPDALTMTALAGAIAAVALLACALPARRASRPDLSTLLRAE